jgi:very-short-patch-repair endonuclease
MRFNLFKRSSTHAERVFAELLKKNKIPFQYKQKVGGREIDFIIGKYAVEIDGHPQDSEKNHMLLAVGYIPIHYSNEAVLKNKENIERWIKMAHLHSVSTK